MTALWLLAADAVLVVHLSFVVFVVGGLVLIYIGRSRDWAWVRGRAFRFAHLGAIGVVIGEAWSGTACPLTSIENALRVRAGASTYAGTFVSHWLEAALYYRAPPWVFVTAYSAFGAAVVASWFVVRPAPTARRRRNATGDRAPDVATDERDG